MLIDNRWTRPEGAWAGALSPAGVLLGTGLRIAELLRLRVKDVDFAYGQITVRDGKGAENRMTMLPASLKPELQEHLKTVQRLHDDDRRQGHGRVYLSNAGIVKPATCHTLRHSFVTNFKGIRIERQGVGKGRPHYEALYAR